MSPTLGLDLRQDGGVVQILLSLISRETPLAGRCDVCCCCPAVVAAAGGVNTDARSRDLFAPCARVVKMDVLCHHQASVVFCYQRVYNLRSCYLVTGEPTGDVQPSSVSRCRHSYKLRLVMINTVGGWLGGRAGAISTCRWQ